MPCTKCEDGKYKWGKTGECEYSSKEACESANSKYSKMKPTPLGKKSYAEYEKELKEFNLSKAERIDLGIMQDGERANKNVRTLITESSSKIGFLDKIENDVVQLVKVIKGIRAEISKKLDIYDSDVKYFKDAKKDVFLIGDNLSKEIGFLNTTVEELTTASKGLGVDIPGLKAMKKTVTDGRSMVKTVEKALNSASLPERPSQSF